MCHVLTNHIYKKIRKENFTTNINRESKECTTHQIQIFIRISCNILNIMEICYTMINFISSACIVHMNFLLNSSSAMTFSHQKHSKNSHLWNRSKQAKTKVFFASLHVRSYLILLDNHAQKTSINLTVQIRRL